MKTAKVPLTPLQKKKLVNYISRGVFTREQVKHYWGWTLEELRPTNVKSEEHYLIRCPKCNSKSVAMVRHYTNMNTPVVHAQCRDCGAYSLGKDYMDAMVKWNKEQIRGGAI